MAAFENYYSIESLDRAMRILMRDEGDMRDRVRKAAPDLCAMQADTCPSSWRRDIRWIQRRLKSRRGKFFNEHAGSDVIGYDFTAAVMYRVTAGKIADRVWRLWSKRQDLNLRRDEQIEAENVKLGEGGHDFNVEMECPECRSIIRTKLRSAKRVLCPCGYRWHIEVSGVGTKKRRRRH